MYHFMQIKARVSARTLFLRVKYCLLFYRKTECTISLYATTSCYLTNIPFSSLHEIEKSLHLSTVISLEFTLPLFFKKSSSQQVLFSHSTLVILHVFCVCHSTKTTSVTCLPTQWLWQPSPCLASDWTQSFWSHLKWENSSFDLLRSKL